MVHVAKAIDKGHNSVMIRTVDTDVVVLAVAAVHTLRIKELWYRSEQARTTRSYQPVIMPQH